MHWCAGLARVRLHDQLAVGIVLIGLVVHQSTRAIDLASVVGLTVEEVIVSAQDKSFVL